MRSIRLAVSLALLSGTIIAAGTSFADDSWVFTTYAGISGGDANGVGTHARFYTPAGAAVDPNGNIFIVDQLNSTIRKITPTGVVSTFAGHAGEPGFADGAGASARFNYPEGIAIDGVGNIYVADSANLTIRKITPEGVVTTLAGRAASPGSLDGLGPKARFNAPTAIAVTSDGTLYVTDSFDQTIRKITPDGLVSTLAGRAGEAGSSNGTGSTARFSLPRGITVAPDGNIYVADSGNSAIRRVTPAGAVSTLAGHSGAFGSADGAGNVATFRFPFGITSDSSGNLIVADYEAQTLRKVTTGGFVTTIAGTDGHFGSIDGAGSDATFNRPAGIALDATGNLYICDYDNYSVRRMSASGYVTTFAGTSSGGHDDGGPDVARFLHPSDVAVEANGNLVVTDAYNHTIRRVTPRGEVSTIAGSAGSPGDANGPASEARFALPGWLAVAGTGDIYVSDIGNFTVRKIATNGDVTTFAGASGELGSDDGTGADARFSVLGGLAVDASGNVFVADSGNSTLRKISPSGEVKTFIGHAGDYATIDGYGGSARLNVPAGITIAPDGNIFVAEENGRTIRKVTPTASISTVAGQAGEFGTEDGVGNAARFETPLGIGADAAGNLFVTDVNAQTVREVAPDRSVTTIGGLAETYGFNNGQGGDARFDTPEGVAVDASGAVYIAEYYSNSIRRGVRCVTGALCPLSGRFQISLAATDPRTGTTGEGVPSQQNDFYGYFSLPGLTGNARNPEVFVKMLDGRDVNGKFWVFYGGLTDFEYTLTVKDTETGSIAIYTKASGASNGGFDVGDGVVAEECAGQVSGIPASPPALPGPCSVGSDSLCLDEGRFRVELSASDPRTGNGGLGAAIAGDDLYGSFALPELTSNGKNPEVFVKMLDGRAENGHFWLFYGGLTDLEYSVTVTDTTTGERKRYEKAAGSACGGYDVSAF